MSTTERGELNDLHRMLAQVLVAQVGHSVEIEGKEGEIEIFYSASPATLAIAAKFLKDNNVTTAIENDENLEELEQILKSKQKKGRATLASVSPIDEAKKHAN